MIIDDPGNPIPTSTQFISSFEDILRLTSCGRNSYNERLRYTLIFPAAVNNSYETCYYLNGKYFRSSKSNLIFYVNFYLFADSYRCNIGRIIGHVVPTIAFLCRIPATC